MSISGSDAVSGLAHVKMTSSTFSALTTVTLAMYGNTAGWYDPIEIRGFVAFGDGHNVTVHYRIDENKRQTWTISNNFAKNLTIDYTVYLRYFDQGTGNGGAYMGYLGSRFLLSWAGWLFLLPTSYKGEVGVSFEIPDTWVVAVPWHKAGDLYVTSADDNFAKSTVGLAPFEMQTSKVEGTELTVAIHQSYSSNDREKTFRFVSEAYGYLSKLFGSQGPPDYLAVYVPWTDDGRRVDFIEAYDSQGEAHDGFGVDLMYGFVHRVFHTFNAFPPTGMGFRSNAEQWFSEGCNVYYDSKIPFVLNYQSDLNLMKDYLSQYDRNFGTGQDGPVASAGNYFNPQSFDHALFLAYAKGSLVNFLLDSLIQRSSQGGRSLDDVLREMYRVYGHKKGYYSNTNIESIGSRIAGHDLSKFFELYVYGNARLPIHRGQPLGIAIEWPQVEKDLGPLPEQTATTETTTIMNMMFQIDGSGSDWVGVQPIIENPKGSSKLAGTNLKTVYAVADANYLYVLIETWGNPDPGNNYVFPVDLNGDGDWDYSFGFNANYAWWYDLRTAPNGQWNNEMALDATYAVGDVAEIAIPLEMMDNPAKIDMLVWIYYPSLQVTVDQTGWGTVRFVTLTTTKQSEMTASTPTTMAELRLTTSPAASPTTTLTPTTQTDWVQPSWEFFIIAVVVIGIALGLLVHKSRRNQ
jgi:predicted metalloprotease with PDZ domain